jgi:hypothetical protein
MSLGGLDGGRLYGFSGGKKISTIIFGRNIARLKILP